jgi:HSP20 family protein
MTQQVPDSWMWEKAHELLERADKLQRRFFQIGRSRYYRPTWEPPVDIFETDEELWIVVALPGVESESLEVVVDAGILNVSGERFLPSPCQRAAVHRLEIPHGRFERGIELPPGRYEVGNRELVRGCLVLSLKKLP